MRALFWFLVVIVHLLALAGCAGDGRAPRDAIDGADATDEAASAQAEIVGALRQALSQGTSSAIAQLGRTDGFWSDPQLRLPLPDFIARYEKPARLMGYGKVLNQFQLSLNRAAEQAAPQLASIFDDAIARMAVTDAARILHGGSDAATRFFRQASGKTLYTRALPMVTQATEQAGVTQQYKKLAARAGPILRLSGDSLPEDLDDFVTQKTLDGIFFKIAKEEARIRADAMAHDTELLKKVFGE